MSNVIGIYDSLKTKNDGRLHNMKLVCAALEGKVQQYYNDYFADAGFRHLIVNNTLKTGVDRIVELVTEKPNINAAASKDNKNSNSQADVKTKIANGYWSFSKLDSKLEEQAEDFVSTGIIGYKVELDFENNMPFLRPLKPLDISFKYNAWGILTHLFEEKKMSLQELYKYYPEHSGTLEAKYTTRTNKNPSMKLLFASTKDKEYVFCITEDSSSNIKSDNASDKYHMLSEYDTPTGKLLVSIAESEALITVEQVTQLVARNRFAMLQMEQAEKNAEAPLIVPNDVTDIPMGKGAVLRTDNPQGVRVADLGNANAANAEQNIILQELLSSLPNPQSPDLPAPRVKMYQEKIAQALQTAISLAFEVDVAVFGDIEKTLNGSSYGTPFKISYVPNKTIKDDYSIEVVYGFGAGMSTGQYLTILQQLQAGGHVSKDYMRKNTPLHGIDPAEEEKKIIEENIDAALIAAIQGQASSIPAMIQQGGPEAGLQILDILIKVKEAYNKGASLSEAYSSAITPPPAPPVAPDSTPTQPGVPPEAGLTADLVDSTGTPVDPNAAVPSEQAGIEQLMSILNGM